MKAVLYVHGLGGSAAEAAHYAPLFPDRQIVGLDYRGSTPWQAGEEIHAAAAELQSRCGRVVLVANSIGAYFSLHARLQELVERAYFVSPVVDMERMIGELLRSSGASEDELARRGEIRTDSGQLLSWEYLCYVREHPVCWNVPTHILRGACDTLVPAETVRAFASRCGAWITVMQHGEHWFHTQEQMQFLDAWIKTAQRRT